MGEKDIKVLTDDMVKEKLQQAQRTRGRAFMTYEELRNEIVDWSMDTVRRRIQNENFPHVRDGAGYLFPRDKVLLWFKKREGQS